MYDIVYTIYISINDEAHGNLPELRVEGHSNALKLSIFKTHFQFISENKSFCHKQNLMGSIPYNAEKMCISSKYNSKQILLVAKRFMFRYVLKMRLEKR